METETYHMLACSLSSTQCVTPIDPTQHLPNEVLWSIFIYTGLLTRKQIACVCKRWRHVLPNWWNYTISEQDLILFTKIPSHQVSILHEYLREEQSKRESSTFVELKKSQQQIVSYLFHLQEVVGADSSRDCDEVVINEVIVDSDSDWLSETLQRHWQLLLFVHQQITQELKLLNVIHACVMVSAEDIKIHHTIRQAAYLQKIQMDLLLSEILYYFPYIYMMHLSQEQQDQLIDSSTTRLTRWDQ